MIYEKPHLMTDIYQNSSGGSISAVETDFLIKPVPVLSHIFDYIILPSSQLLYIYIYIYEGRS